MSVLSDIRDLLQRGSVDWKDRFVSLGYGGHVVIGSFSTPITGGGAGTILDQDQPEGVISTSAGYTLIPLRITVQCHVPLLASDADECEILVAADTQASYSLGSGTMPPEPVFNMNGGRQGPAGVMAASAGSGNITNPTLDLELDRSVITGDVQGTPASALWTPLGLLYEPVVPPRIKGPCAIYIYFGGTVAVTGFAQASFLCVPDEILPRLL